MTDSPSNDDLSSAPPIADGGGRWWKRLTLTTSDSDPRTLGKWIGVFASV